MAIDTIAAKVASVLPNIAYVTDVPIPGRTVKACQRSLMNLIDGRFGGSPAICEGGHSWLTMGEYRSKALSVVKPHEELEPLESDHLLRRLIENPNPHDTFFDLEYELQMFEELCGVSYEWLVPNDYGTPVERWCIPSHWVWPRTGGLGRIARAEYDPYGRRNNEHYYVPPDNPHADELIHYYEVRPWGGMGSAGILRLPPNEVIMTRWKSPINKIDGYSKLAAIAQWIDSEESISKSRWSQFINQARPEFWVELGPGYEDPSDDRIARIEAKFAAKLQGEFNYGKPVITPPGAKITPLSFSPNEMAYFASEEQVRDMILSTWRVPPAAVGIVKEMTYGSILATLAALCQWCINPRLQMHGLSRTKHLASRFDEPGRKAWSTGDGKVGQTSTTAGRKARIWWDDCVPADPSQVNADIAQDLSGNAITPNEIRALRGRRSYKAGGNDPMGPGPGGVMPIPLNTGENLTDFASLIAPLTATEGMQTTESEAAAISEGLLPAPGGNGKPLVVGGGGGGEKNTLVVEGENTPILANRLPATGSPKIAKPNSKPSKRWVCGPAGSQLNWQQVLSMSKKALDSQGGELPAVDSVALATADFITLPEGVSGTNCSNCLFQQKGVCNHPQLTGQPVNSRNCCAYWDAKGALRDGKTVTKRTKEIGAARYVIDEDLWAECLVATARERPAVIPSVIGHLYGGKVDVVIADGDKVKTAPRLAPSNRGYDEEDHMDFVEGGNTSEDPDLYRAVWGRPIPEGARQVYLDDRTTPADWKYICYHEGVELPLMIAGIKYDSAHARANAGELELRRRDMVDLAERGAKPAVGEKGLVFDAVTATVETVGGPARSGKQYKRLLGPINRLKSPSGSNNNKVAGSSFPAIGVEPVSVVIDTKGDIEKFYDYRQHFERLFETKP